ncbi:MAG TPA: hypothetical protein DEA96_07685 [Leptospiraceae bacterium]|nr:hypothetical protein [Spirochaetaceae bacterium]HBS04827.1 hypothetical protein [Leptospiraceae bacterium]|tara:strand:+ start:66527 stop:66871 length:345 start_codon:yes stop_codon:yes gene_type:complete
MYAEPMAFFHFRVRIYHRGKFFRAYLLSLSETGALFAMDSKEYLQLDTSRSVRGSVDSRYGTELEFKGRIVRKEGLQLRDQFFYTVSVEFEVPRILSDVLLATTLSVQPDLDFA